LDNESIDAALEDVDEEAELATVKELAKKKLMQAKYQDQRKLMAYLTSKGFSYPLVRKAFDELGDLGVITDSQ
jgi:SOS response regulatory protein OraA/RecX